MNRILLAFSTIFFFFFSNLSCKELNGEEKDLTNEQIDIKNLKKFFQYLNQICLSQKLFKNLKKHKSYPKFGSIEDWEKTCEKIRKKSGYTLDFVRRNFRLISLQNKKGLLKGYYEPLIKISKIKNDNYKFPILKFNEKFVGIPRKSIESNYKKSDVLLWTNNKIDLFFLQIQGSGIGIFPDQQKVKILYSGNNEKEYRSIGKLLIRKNLIKKKDVSLFTIKEFLKNNKNLINEIFNYNERYIFFNIDNYDNNSAYGALGMNLEPNVSIAIDKKYYPLGLPFLFRANDKDKLFLAIASDTGSAIIGPNRADLFTGSGKLSEEIAGNLKKKLILYVLVPYSN